MRMMFWLNCEEKEKLAIDVTYITPYELKRLGPYSYKGHFYLAISDRQFGAFELNYTLLLENACGECKIKKGSD
jgi:hypothetical protein